MTAVKIPDVVSHDYQVTNDNCCMSTEKIDNYYNKDLLPSRVSRLKIEHCHSEIGKCYLKARSWKEMEQSGTTILAMHMSRILSCIEFQKSQLKRHPEYFSNVKTGIEYMIQQEEELLQYMKAVATTEYTHPTQYICNIL